MNKKRIAIIGANDSVVLLIKKAKSLGYETHVFAWKCGDPGEKEADFFYPISISDKEAILKKCREIGVCGVCSITSDFAAPVVAYVSRALGLPSNPEKTDVVARNKYEMRKTFKETGAIYCPKFIEADENFDADSTKDFHFPVIVKPTDRWSSKGITCVESEKGLKNAVKVAINESFNKKAIIEEYVEGPEYSAECIAWDGNIEILAFTKKMTTGSPHYIETGHVQPSDIPLEKQDTIKKVIKTAIRALGIKNSAAHAEFRIMDNGDICFMEIGARMGGDCIGTDLTPLSTGIDYIKMVIDVACGNTPSFQITSKPKKVMIKFIINEEDYSDFKKLNKSSIIRSEIYNLDFNKEVIDSSTRHGFYIVEV